jgi:uncharacterized protein (DUF924 family)
MDEARLVRDFWFGKLPMSAETLSRRFELWFGTGPSAEVRQRGDELIRARFGALFERAAAGQLAGWADSPRKLLSLVILLDQFPRHLFRGTSQAFAYDEQALAVTLSGMQSAADGALDPVERIFLYMPLQHAESREVQDESVAAYRRLLSEAPRELRSAFEQCLESAREHQAIIEQFGRFPHRNQVLQRASTPAEEAWLRGGGAKNFGQ